MTAAQLGDSLLLLPAMESESFSLICTDPPYGIHFMGAEWDMGLPDPGIWVECLRVLKPGGFLFSFMSARQDCYVEFVGQLKAAGFDVGWPSIVWYYKNGLPKGKNLSKEADRLAGVERPVVGKYRPPEMRSGWGLKQASDQEVEGSGGYATASGRRLLDVTAPVTREAVLLEGLYGGRAALKPAHEMIVVAQKPLVRSPIVANALEWGVGGLGCDEARIPASGAGRFPATVVVTDQALGEDSRYFDADRWLEERVGSAKVLELETGWAVGCAKASSAEKEAGLEPGLADPLAQHRGRRSRSADTRPDGKPARCAHPTVKPLSLMAWLISLGCPHGGRVLDPFCGTGTGGVAALLLGREWVGIEREARYHEIARARIAGVRLDMLP